MGNEIKYGVILPTPTNPWQYRGLTAAELRELVDEADANEASLEEMLGDEAILPAVIRDLLAKAEGYPEDVS